MTEQGEATVLIISDDAELGGLIAQNLRENGHRVEHTDLVLAGAQRWAPSGGRPRLLVVYLDAPTPASPARLRHLTERPWARGVPLVLAAADPTALSRILPDKPASILARPTDVGSIVRAVEDVLAAGPPG